MLAISQGTSSSVRDQFPTTQNLHRGPAPKTDDLLVSILFEKDMKLATRLFYSKNATEGESVVSHVSRPRVHGSPFIVKLLAINAKSAVFELLRY